MAVSVFKRSDFSFQWNASPRPSWRMKLHFVFPLKCSLSPKKGHFVWLEFLCLKSLFYCTHEKREPSLTASRYFLSNLIYCERSMRTTPLSLEKRPLLNRKSTGKRTNYSLLVKQTSFMRGIFLKSTQIMQILLS